MRGTCVAPAVDTASLCDLGIDDGGIGVLIGLLRGPVAPKLVSLKYVRHVLLRQHATAPCTARIACAGRHLVLWAFVAGGVNWCVHSVATMCGSRSLEDNKLTEQGIARMASELLPQCSQLIWLG